MDESLLVTNSALELLALLPLLNRMFATEVRREVGEETSIVQVRLLTMLREGPQTLTTLARQCHVSPQALSDVAHALVERGWVTREPHVHDRRQFFFHLTETGCNVQSEAQKHLLHQTSTLLSDLKPAELNALHVALPALRRALNLNEQSQPMPRQA